MKFETQVASAIDLVGMWWPLADEDKLCVAADAYGRVGEALRDASAAGSAWILPRLSRPPRCGHWAEPCSTRS